MIVSAPRPLPLEPIAFVVVTAVPEFNVNVLLAPETSPPIVSAELFELVLMMVFATNVIGVAAAPIVTAPPLTIFPPKLIAAGAVAVNPPDSVNVSVASSPNCKVPVFAKVTALVIFVTLPRNAKLYNPAPELKLVVLKLLLSVKLPVTFNAASGVVPPMTPVTLISFEPAFNVRV